MGEEQSESGTSQNGDENQDVASLSSTGSSGIRINNNIGNLRAINDKNQIDHSQGGPLRRSSQSLSDSLERLSRGLKIRRESDSGLKNATSDPSEMDKPSTEFGESGKTTSAGVEDLNRGPDRLDIRA